jgi:hypothetical protein
MTVKCANGADARARALRPRVLIQGSVSACLLSVLIACGGGGGGGGSTPTTPPPVSTPQGAPVAHVSAPGTVAGFSTVYIDASASTDTKSSISSYAWKQTAGPTVTLSNGTTSTASFMAPAVTANTTVSFSVLITDALGTTATGSVSIKVTPAAAATPASFVGADFQTPVLGNPHNDSTPTNSNTPQRGSSLILHVALGGSVASANFAFLSSTGTQLSTFSLVQSSNSGRHPIDYFGPVSIPTVPFFIQATGKTGDGAAFAVQSSQLITPLAIGVSLDRTQAHMVPGSTLTLHATVSNAGSSTTFALIAVDPQGFLVGGPPVQTITVAANAQGTFPITVTFPATGTTNLARLAVLVQDANTPTVQALTYFTAIRDGAPP